MFLPKSINIFFSFFLFFFFAANAPMGRNSITAHERKFSETALDSSSPAPMKEAVTSAPREEEPSRETDLSFIPMDVWAEILLRIPAEDLVKLKTVCKSWYEQVTSQSFAYSHLDHWKSRSVNGFAMQRDYGPDGSPNSPILYFTLDVNGNEERLQGRNFLIENWHHYLRETQFTTELRLLTSCDGLLLIGYASENHYQLFICNPITGSYRSLPIFQPPHVRGCRIYTGSISQDYEWAVVRNASTGQYKVFGLQHSPIFMTQWKCYVFELQRDGELQPGRNWKELDAPLHESWNVLSSITTETSVHWLVHSMDELKTLSIDISTDELRTSAPIELLPEMLLVIELDGTVYSAYYDGSREWTLENIDHPKWVEKDVNDYRLLTPSLSISMEQFVLPGGAKLAADYRGITNLITIQNIFPHVNSLVGCC